VADRADEQQAALDELLGLLEHERRGDAWVGRTPDWAPVVFGGIALTLILSAACRDAPAGSRLHSVHAHFLRPVKGAVRLRSAARS
jgi:acyl-CoA thioesterase